MRRTGWLAGLLVVVGACIAEGQEPKPSEPPSVVEAELKSSPDRSIADRFHEIKAEFDAQNKALQEAYKEGQTQREQNELYAKLSPDDTIYSRRMIDLAQSKPDDPSARDALIWVVNKLYRSDEGSYGDEFARAAALLVRHHGDDPSAISVALNLNHVLSAHRDELLLGFYASAKSREAKGVARLALAMYLEQKAIASEAAHKHPGRDKMRLSVIGADGKTYDERHDERDEDYAYSIGLRLCDPRLIRSEAERLYNEVIAEYGDIPTSIGRRLRIEAAFKQAVPVWDGHPITDEDRREFAKVYARKDTLGSVAEGHLDEMNNLIAGKPAPEIAGVDINGKPLKLSDYRGKVVVLVFWGSWCGPCMAEVPHERELAERYKDRPFAVLGVDCNEAKSAGLKAIDSEHITWPNWNDGENGDGPIVKRYHIRMYPSVFVIDPEGIIRHKLLSDSGLDNAIEELVKQQEAKATKK